MWRYFLHIFQSTQVVNLKNGIILKNVMNQKYNLYWKSVEITDVLLHIWSPNRISWLTSPSILLYIRELGTNNSVNWAFIIKMIQWPNKYPCRFSSGTLWASSQSDHGEIWIHFVYSHYEDIILHILFDRILHRKYFQFVTLFLCNWIYAVWYN